MEVNTHTSIGRRSSHEIAYDTMREEKVKSREGDDSKRNRLRNR